MQVWVGTSGYSYPDWVGGFYPPGTRANQMLAYYVQHFPLVELNFTFYRLPAPEMLARMGDQTPEGFQFLVKLPRTLSHDHEPQELAAFKNAVEQLRRRGKLLGLLCQFPQACHHADKHRRWMEFLASELAGLGLAVEFRHRSWSGREVTHWLQDRGVDLVAVDVPEIPALYPRGLVQSSSRIYVRFHSRLAKNWYQSDKDRYDYDYDDAALQEWIDALRSAPAATEQAMLLFNNCQRSQAAANAARMQELLRMLAPEMNVVPPPAAPSPEPRQQLLFE